MPADIAHLVAVHGNEIPLDDIRDDKAKAFVRFVREHPEFGIVIDRARQRENDESLEVTVHPSVGQEPKNDIRSEESLLLVFASADTHWPMVYSLRADFPTGVPHLNVPNFGEPSTICLTDQMYDEARRDWTPAFYVALLLRWLEETAKGTLHQADQTVEPFLLHSEGMLIVPHRVLSEEITQDVVVGTIDALVFRLYFKKPDPEQGEHTALLRITIPAHTHGGIPAVPRSLAELASMTDDGKFSLVEKVCKELERYRADAAAYGSSPIVLIQIPLRAHDGAPVERYDLQAFYPKGRSLFALGEALGIWDKRQPGGLVISGARPDGSGIEIGMLNVQPTLSPDRAAACNDDQLLDVGYVAIGCGSLGSQVLASLTRSGWRPQAVIDHDPLLPHNMARHALFDDLLGVKKADALGHVLSNLTDAATSVAAIPDNILCPSARATQALAEAGMILDLSASVAVLRALAVDSPSAARRMSVFLNPTGTDLVLLKEDSHRTARLDHIELQYLWTVATDDRYVKHMHADSGLRYGTGCRDISARIKQSSVATLGGIAAAAIRRSAASEPADAFLWQLDEETGVVTRSVLETRPMVATTSAGWTILLSIPFLEQIQDARARKLPNETGGVLIGSLDFQRSIAYVVGTVPAPPDSEEWPTSYIRGFVGLRGEVDLIHERSANVLRYLGEWHSHPAGHSVRPSSYDQKAFEWLTRNLDAESRPAIMMIVGDDRSTIMMGSSQTEIAIAA